MGVNPRTAAKTGERLGMGAALALCGAMCAMGLMISSATNRPYALLTSVFGSGAILAGASSKSGHQ